MTFFSIYYTKNWNPLSSFTLFRKVFISYFALTQTSCDVSKCLSQSTLTFSTAGPKAVVSHFPACSWREGQKRILRFLFSWFMFTVGEADRAHKMQLLCGRPSFPQLCSQLSTQLIARNMPLWFLEVPSQSFRD